MLVVSTGVPYTFAIRCQASFPRTYVNEYCPSDDGERASQMNDKRPVLSITLVSTPDRGRSSSTVQKTHYFFFFFGTVLSTFSLCGVHWWTRRKHYFTANSGFGSNHFS